MAVTLMADHAKCHADINMLLAELARLRAALKTCAAAGREADEALTYRAEHIDAAKRPPELSPEERAKRADQRDRGVLNRVDDG